MKTPLPVPKNESTRLDRLRYYDILDSEEEGMFDDLTKLTAQILDVPTCVISLVDDDRQWFKSRYGEELKETPRDISFCQYTIMDTRIMEVGNALLDERFNTSPLVKDKPSIRFYAGSPLVDEEGASIGALCAIDSKPRELDDQKRGF